MLVEDDADIAKLVTLNLSDLGFVVSVARDAVAGWDAIITEEFDLYILDVMLPLGDGLDLCRRIRARTTTPIIFLTARTEEIDRVLGLELGADDYVSKPFSIRELVARVKAVFRRTGQETAENKGELSFPGLKIDMEKRKVLRDGVVVELTAKEFDLLAFLAASPGRPYTRNELLGYVWDYQFEGYEHTVSAHINRIRTKIEADPAAPRYIRTAWGVGYRFAEAEELGQ